MRRKAAILQGSSCQKTCLLGIKTAACHLHASTQQPYHARGAVAPLTVAVQRTTHKDLLTQAQPKTDPRMHLILPRHPVPLPHASSLQHSMHRASQHTQAPHNAACTKHRATALARCDATTQLTATAACADTLVLMTVHRQNQHPTVGLWQ